MWIVFLGTAVLAFVLPAGILHRLIPVLMSRKMNQPILEIGPRWHKNKGNTPTMGGLSFFVAVPVSFAAGAAALLIAGLAEWSDLLPAGCTVLFALLTGAIGIADDRGKLLHRSNEEGLSAGKKYLLQLAIAALYLAGLRLLGFGTTLRIPFTDLNPDLGIFYYPVALFLLTGIVNAVNLTDGVDGLAGSLTAISGVLFAATALLSAAPGCGQVAAAAVGTAAGFLVYNAYPARVFMGDTGSLFLGALLVGCAFLCGNPLIVLLYGIVFVAETAAVILQTLFYKFTRIVLKRPKRLFAMTPLHHHFEHRAAPDRPSVLPGHEWPERRIVAVFCAVGAVCGTAALIFEYCL